jgi:sterol 3beta-glucosyltransferase
MSARKASVSSNLRLQPTKQDEPATDFSGHVGQVTISTGHSNVEANVNDDGRVDVKLTQKAVRITKDIEKRFHHPKFPIGEHLTKNNRKYDAVFQSVLGKFEGVPKLNLAIHIVGSRGDVQPFIAIGQILQNKPYGHRVRICTHPVFKDFVEENGLEFFSIGGDPATLMAYMVKNPGLMPGRESWKAGDVGKRRADIAEILEGCWRSCIESGNGMGEVLGSAKPTTNAEIADSCFIADAIIASRFNFLLYNLSR